MNGEVEEGNSEYPNRAILVRYLAMRTILVLSLASVLLAGCAARHTPRRAPGADAERDLAELLERWPADPGLALPDETRLRDIRQLTFGGENAEAYWSPDGRSIIWQATPREELGTGCDQEFILDLETGSRRLVSTGGGKTTCGYFVPGTNRIVYSSTHHVARECPPPPDRSRGYVWKLHDEFDVFSANRTGGGVRRLTDTPGYDAEATFREDGERIVYTSLRSGDLDIWSMRPDGSDQRRLTTTLGYEGGPFYSPDGSRIVYRAHIPRTDMERRDYRELLADRLIRPMRLEIFIMDADGTGIRQITDNGAANFAPYWFRDGERVIFASNVADPQRRDFDLWTVRDDGSDLERITTNPSFDGFPMFSPDGRYLLFCSNRNNENPHETNIFIAEWVEDRSD